MLPFGSVLIFNEKVFARAVPLKLRRRAPRAAWFAVTLATATGAYLLSMLISFFGDLIAIVGASVGMVVVYVLPCVVALKIVPLGALETVAVEAVLVVAVLFLLLGTYATFQVLVDDWSSFGPPFSC